MSISNYTLNQRISNLQTEINEIISGVIPIPSSATLDNVLTNGNDGGDNDITNIDNITCNQLNYTTLNPPVSGVIPTYDEVLNAGNSASEKNAIITGTGSIGTSTSNISKNTLAFQDTDGTGNQKSCNLTNTNTSFSSQVPFGYTNQLDLALATGSSFCGLSHTDNFPSPSNLSISTNKDLVLIAGENATSYSNIVQVNPLAPTYATQLTNDGILSYQKSAPSFYSSLSTSQIKCNNGAVGSSYMTYGGYTTANNTGQLVSLQPTQLIATNDFTILTQTVGDISIYAKDTLNLKATDNASTGKGISIDKTTPNIWYNLNTANVNDRVVLDNNGNLSMVSVSNSAITDVSPNSIILQHPSVSNALEMDSDLGIRFTTASASVNSSFTSSQLTFNGSATTSSYLNPTTLNVSNTNQGTSVVNGGSVSIIQSSAGGTPNPPISTLINNNATGSVYTEIYKNKPTAGANGDVLYTQSVYGKDSANTKQEYTRITHTIRDATAGAEDASLELGCFVNGGFANFIQLNANDSPIGEVNFIRPLDFIGGSDANSTIKTSGTGSVNLNLDATSSNGTGAIALKTKNGVAGSGGGLLLTGNTLLDASAGGSSGQHLCLTIGGVVYKIALLNA